MEPQLAPPGAGLPALEHLIARVLFGLRRKLGNRASFTAKFLLERERIRTLLHGVDPEAGARRVLIRRPRGLEDSSRYWSVWMTLDHLRIVHDAFIGIVGALASGHPPETPASTAAVKPSPTADATVAVEYEASCNALLAAVAAVPDPNTPARYAHPWFGPMTAAGWYALAGAHMAIHRVQIERILAGASSESGPR